MGTKISTDLHFHLSLNHTNHTIEEIHVFVNDAAKLTINDLPLPAPGIFKRSFDLLRVGLTLTLTSF